MKKYKEKLKDVPSGFAETYSVGLYIKENPIILEKKLLQNIKKYCGKVEIISNKESNITFAFMDHVLEYKNASVPVSLMISIIDEEKGMKELGIFFEPSTNYHTNNDLSKNSKIRVLITDLMAVGLNYVKRVELFQKALYAIVEVLPCEGINFNITEQVISRKDYLENNPLNDDYDLLFGMLNVRKFNVEGKENEYIMDTLGLSALGLCDLQCHYKSLNSNHVSDILYAYGYYIFDNPQAADSMKEIEGISKEEKWKCRHEVALVKPERVVLDINPGGKFSGIN